MVSPIHESVASMLNEAFITTKASLPASIESRISTVTNQKFNGFGGQYWGSNKTPDLTVISKRAEGNFEAKFILGVGFSEAYDDLVQDAKLWLEGRRDIFMFVLVKFEETPDYRYPLGDLNSEDFEQLGFPKDTELIASNFSLTGDYGPTTYKGFVWVGQISVAFMEIWKRDPITGLATLNGNRIIGYH
jgi:hypothetical protein